MTSANGTARSGLLAAGIVVLIVGVLTAAGLWYSAGQRYDDAVKGLARAPIGCDTTLDFADSGTFLVFIETQGSVKNIAGDCTAATEYQSAATAVPAVQLTMLDPDGDDVALADASGTTYDTAGFTGESIRSVEIATAGDHVLRVEASPDVASTDVAVAVGRDPNDGVGMLKLGAALAAIVGLVGGGVLLVAATRTRRSVPAALPTFWPPDGSRGVPTAPPGMPQPPPPAGWQPAVGPPSQIPGQPPFPDTSNEQSPGPPVTPAPAPPLWRPQQPVVPQAPPGGEDFDTIRGDGSADGERSPWAAPPPPAKPEPTEPGEGQ